MNAVDAGVGLCIDARVREGVASGFGAGVWEVGGCRIGLMLGILFG